MWKSTYSQNFGLDNYNRWKSYSQNQIVGSDCAIMETEMGSCQNSSFPLLQPCIELCSLEGTAHTLHNPAQYRTLLSQDRLSAGLEWRVLFAKTRVLGKVPLPFQADF